jgi:tetratricopeptide (TPR) repeat protein
MAASTVTAAASVAIGQLRRPRLTPVPTAILAVTALATLLALVAAGAKGGALAAAVGFTGLLLAAACTKLTLAPRVRALLGAVFGLAAVVGPIALILIRGQIGERMSELSLFFRWFYVQGAARIFAANPMGVGPDGFQQAYLLAKPPISPEEVTSPHSITLDWLADLGIPGFAWVAVLLIAAAAIGRVLTASTASLPASPPSTPLPPPTDRNELRLILLIPGLATLLAAWLERGAVTPDGALVRLLGLFGWCAIAWAVLNLARAIPNWPIAFAAGAAALLAHIQIDVAASWPQSVGLIALWLALGCTRVPADQAATPSTFPRFFTAIPIAILACLAIALSAPTQVWRWQSALLAANARLGDVADLNARFSALADGSSTENPSALAASVAAALARREPGRHASPRNTDELRTAMARLESLALADAAAVLRAAARIEPSDWRVRREASRLLIRAAAAANAVGDATLAGKLLDDSIAALELPDPAPPAPSDTHSRTTAPEWRWLAIAWSESARHTDDPGLQGFRLTLAAAALKRAADLDPYNLEIALRLMRVYTQIGDPANAARWAHKVLELDPLMRLDQAARGLTDSERAEAERTARSP